MLNCFSTKMKENQISRSFDQLAVLFKENFRRQSYIWIVWPICQNQPTKWKRKETKNSRLLFFVVDPCKRIDTNEHKEAYLQLNCCGSLEVINTRRKKSVQNLQLRNPKGGLKGRKKFLWTAEGYRHKGNTKIDCCGPWVKLNGQHKAQKQSGFGFESTQNGSGVSFERNSTQNGCTQKWLRKLINTILNWMDTKKWSSCC